MVMVMVSSSAACTRDFYEVVEEEEEAVVEVEDEQAAWLSNARRMIEAAYNNGSLSRVMAVALAAFDGETEVDLTVREGDTLWLYDGVDAPESWRICETVNGMRGLVPETFVQIAPPKQQVAAAAAEVMMSGEEEEEPAALLTTPIKKTDQEMWLDEAADRIEAAANMPRVPAIALATFEGETAVDLTVREGERLWLCKGADAPESWVICELTGGQRGLAPETFIREVPPEEQEVKASTTPVLPAVEEVEPESGEKEGWIRDAQSMISDALSSGNRVMAVALAPFEGETEVDLSITAGDRLWVYPDAQAPESWMIATQYNNGEGGETGLVPATFTQISQVQETPTSPAAVAVAASPAPVATTQAPSALRAVPAQAPSYTAAAQSPMIASSLAPSPSNAEAKAKMDDAIAERRRIVEAEAELARAAELASAKEAEAKAEAKAKAEAEAKAAAAEEGLRVAREEAEAVRRESAERERRAVEKARAEALAAAKAEAETAVAGEGEAKAAIEAARAEAAEAAAARRQWPLRRLLHRPLARVRRTVLWRQGQRRRRRRLRQQRRRRRRRYRRRRSPKRRLQRRRANVMRWRRRGRS